MSDRVYMLNALWFKKDGGAQKYMEYGIAAAPFVEALGGKRIDGYQPQQSLIGDWDPELFFLVEWPIPVKNRGVPYAFTRGIQ